MLLPWCVIMGKFISRVFSCLFCVFEEDLTLLSRVLSISPVTNLWMEEKWYLSKYWKPAAFEL